MHAIDAKIIADNYNLLPDQKEYSSVIESIRFSAIMGLYSFIWNGTLSSYTLTTLSQKGFITTVNSNPNTVVISWS